jgi:hypothetical protein
LERERKDQCSLNAPQQKPSCSAELFEVHDGALPCHCSPPMSTYNPCWRIFIWQGLEKRGRLVGECVVTPRGSGTRNKCDQNLKAR